LNFRVFAGVRNQADGDLLRAQASGQLTPIRIDVTNGDSIAAASQTISDEVDHHRLISLVNNAGIGVVGPLELVTLADLRRQFDVNVFGAMAITQALLPLIRQGRGRIVNISSIAGRACMPYMGPYAASKHALEALSDAMRLELRHTGVHVAIIEPGAIATPIWAKSKSAIEDAARNWSAESKQLYLDDMSKVKAAAARAEQNATPVSLVADAVIHALTSPRPKTRYLVGKDAKVRALLSRFLPDHLQDRILTAVLKLPTKK
jgi:NAD(P)-dependent dehydrogenase (short-subunit alcohol dehydrogenase family)